MLCQSCYHECHADNTCTEEVYLADSPNVVCACQKCTCFVCEEEG